MKKALAVLLAASMLLGMLCGCTTTPQNENGTTGETTPGETTPGTDTPGGDTSASEPITDWVTYLTTNNEMETFNILYSQRNQELRVLTNCIEGLLSNDSYGNLIPAVAETWNTEDGGLTWTFNLRKDVTWVDVNGNKKADCIAEDWLWGLEWVLNFWKNEAANTSMPIEMIQGAEDYYIYTKGTNSDSTPEDIAAFEAVCNKYGLSTTPLTEAEAKALDLTVFKQIVGIEAPDDYTLIYHCTAALPYFATLAAYNCLYPASGALLVELGVDGFKACTNENMWYSGCYTMTTYVQGNEKVLTKNESYWDKDCTLFNTVTIKMVESSDVAFQLYQSGELDYVELTESNLQTIYKSTSNEFHDQLCEARPTKYSYQFHLVYDKKTEAGEPDNNWNLAIANKAFRLAWYYGLDLTKYLARTNAINPLKCENYCYTMNNLCVTSDGTDYTQLVLDRLGIDPTGDTYARLDTGKFAEYKAQAMEELAAKGVTFPVVADYYILGSSQTAADTAAVLKQIFTDCLGDDFVVLNVKTYISSLAQEVRNPQLASFFINGWGADYGDPQNYLGQETYGEDNAYYSAAYSKINNATDPDLIATYQEYTRLVNAANAITGDLDARYNAYADAEAYMLENALVIPCYINILWQLTHVNDFSKIYAAYGIQSEKFKNWETSQTAYTTEDYAALEAAYNSGK
ncbi:MAG: ABC transporter substrate-binding protein [Clostridiaceae bacterium]|nr:ABC transporter substrate-binding protein [Clostridiaceae bacterium]